MQMCIIVAIGLPGSGKTTLVSELSRQLTDDANCYIVEYDKLMPPNVEHCLIVESLQTDKTSSWKKYREDIVSCVDKLLDKVSKQNKNKVSVASVRDDLEVPQIGAEDKLSADTSTPQAAASMNVIDTDLWTRFTTVVCADNMTAGGRDIIVIVDDNMYYRSMRYDYYQLARKYSVGFCQVFVDSPTDTALARNRQRLVGRVDDRVIVDMATKMEIPDSSKFHWEKHSVVWNQDRGNCSKVVELVRTALKDPVLVPIDDTESRDESRRACSASVIHQADQTLRKLLTKVMKTAKESGKSKDEMKTLSTTLMSVKSTILDDMRSGEISFDTEVTDAAKDDNSELFNFVTTLFETRISEIT